MAGGLGPVRHRQEGSLLTQEKPADALPPQAATEAGKVASCGVSSRKGRTRDAGLLAALQALDLVAHKALDHARQIVVEPSPEHRAQHLTHHIFESRRIAGHDRMRKRKRLNHWRNLVGLGEEPIIAESHPAFSSPGMIGTDVRTFTFDNDPIGQRAYDALQGHPRYYGL